MKQVKVKSDAKYILLGLFFFVGACKSETRASAEYYLGRPIPEEASGIHFKKINFSPDYIRPYNIYLTFTLPDTNFLDFIQTLDLVSYKNYKKVMCLDNIDSGFVSSLWGFKSRNRFNTLQDVSDGISWWKPDEGKGVSLFASFYSESSMNKFIHCYRMPWDGRILLEYDKKTYEVYILIEVLM